MRISIFASIWSQNLWDELILKNEIKHFEDKYEDARFRVFSYDAENPFYTQDNIEYKNYFPIGIRNPRNILKNIGSIFHLIKSAFWSDIIVVGWGGLFYDWESNNSALTQWRARVNFFHSLRRKIVFYWVSIDVRDEKNYEYISDIFSKAAEIYVRDEYSHRLLQSLGIKSEVIVDPVFYDRGEKPKKTSCIKSIDSHDFSLSDFDDIDWEWKKIGIALRNIWTSGYRENIASLLEMIVERGWELIYLPHSFHESDNQANDQHFLSSFPNKWYISESMKETYSFYVQGKIDICLAQRFHAMVLSDVYEIPFIGMSYSQKTKSLLEKLNK